MGSFTASRPETPHASLWEICKNPPLPLFGFRCPPNLEKTLSSLPSSPANNEPAQHFQSSSAGCTPKVLLSEPWQTTAGSQTRCQAGPADHTELASS